MTTDDTEARRYARALFAAADDETGTWGSSASVEPEQPTTPGNHVPSEGTNPPASEPDDMRTFATELFSRALRD